MKPKKVHNDTWYEDYYFYLGWSKKAFVADVKKRFGIELDTLHRRIPLPLRGLIPRHLGMVAQGLAVSPVCFVTNFCDVEALHDGKFSRAVGPKTERAILSRMRAASSAVSADPKYFVFPRIFSKAMNRFPFGCTPI